MKIKIKNTNKEIVYIPIRYIIAIAISVLEILTILGIVILLCLKFPLFYSVAMLTQFFCVVRIVASDDNPDYKVPWLLFVLILPVIGFMLYFMLYSRKLKPKFKKRLNFLTNITYNKDDRVQIEQLEKKDEMAASQAKMLRGLANTHIFQNTKIRYFPLGEQMQSSLICDLEKAQKFIFMEYFIIEEGAFWDSVFGVLKSKAAAGVDIKILYDDIGCMLTLPYNFSSKLKKHNIECIPFSKLRGNADSEFNNRCHRKITVIDGKIAYTGGINIADEYINKKQRFGHWKDTAIRLEGEAVYELTKLFIIDYGINIKKLKDVSYDCFPKQDIKSEDGFIIPFGDGPLGKHRAGKELIKNMLSSATEYVYITTPYLIIDNDTATAIENAAYRGVDVKIMLPHIPDKKIVFAITRSYYHRLMAAGVEIYEYEIGFLHAKNYLADDKYAMVGTINLDYRSLAHHFENGVWMYDSSVISDIKNDMQKTLDMCIRITPDMLKINPIRRFLYALVRIFAPLM